MRRVGIRVPAGPRRRLASAAIARARFVLRGDRVRFRTAAELSGESLAGIDLLQGAAQGTSMLDQTLGDVLAARSLLAALDACEPSRVLRAIGLEARLLVDHDDGELAVGDCFVLVTDGVWATLGDAGIAAVMAAHAGDRVGKTSGSTLESNSASGGRSTGWTWRQNKKRSPSRCVNWLPLING